jgi:hypothetical protein
VEDQLIRIFFSQVALTHDRASGGREAPVTTLARYPGPTTLVGE